MICQFNKWISYLYAGLVFFPGLQSISGQEDIVPAYSFQVDTLFYPNREFCSWPVISPSGKESILFNPVDESIRFTLPGYDEGVPFNPDGYVIIDLEHNNKASLVVILEFTRAGDEPDDNGWVHSRVSCRIGVLPGLPTRAVFPLSYLNAQNVFLPKMPRQLKGTLSGNRMEVRDIDNVFLRLKNTSDKFPQKAYIHGIYLYDHLPPRLPDMQTPVVDSLGQWNTRDWKGKFHSFSELREEAGRYMEDNYLGEVPDSRSDYLGFKSIRFDSTGFFHTHFDGKRWWLVDPRGYAYLSIAPTGVRPFSHGPVEGNEDLFEWLPPDTGAFKKAYAVQGGLKSLSFVTINLIRTLGSNFIPEWTKNTAWLLKDLGFTGSGNWSDRVFYQNSEIPYFYPMRGFPTTSIKLFRDFPDVFDPAFSESALEYALQLEAMKNDPYMVGYFLGNEPQWAFGEYNIAREMMYKSEGSYSRIMLIRWLAEKYGNDPDLFSAAWGYEFYRFEDLKYFILPRDSDMRGQAEKDLKEFSSLLIDKYVATICEATKTADPNHLNLGLRFAWISSEACLQSGEYFDVFSLNGYTFPDPPDTRHISGQLNKPVLIGEFHFGSIDSGLPATGIKGVKNQRARGLAYRHYVEQGFARPEIVGIHYFQWNDQPLTGRFDGENYNIGLIDVTGNLYHEMAKQIRKTNFSLKQIATGEKGPMRRVPGKIPDIYY